MRAGLAPKSRNHIRATLAMFFRWAIKNDYLTPNHRLLEAAGMERETVIDVLQLNLSAKQGTGATSRTRANGVGT